MRAKPLQSVLLVASTLALLGMSLNPETAQPATLAAIGYHDPIRIVGDSGFTNGSGVTWGSGTADDPYLIEGWDASVSITNTTAHVILRNMTIMGYSVNIWYAGGLYLNNVSHCAVEYCSLVRAPYEDFTQFYLVNCSNVSIWRNHIEKYITIKDSSDVRIESNLIVGYDIEIRQSEMIQVLDNILIDPSAHKVPGWAIHVTDSRFVTIRHNYIENRTASFNEGSYGVCLESSESVDVLGNLILNNTHQAADDAGSANSWNSSYPTGGNYWSDYTGTDLFQGPGQDVPGSDGIGDTPYSIDADSADFYPLMDPPSAPILTDTDPPFVRLVIEGAKGNHGWYLSSVLLTIEAFDIGSGINHTSVALGNGSFEECIEPFPFIDDGNYTLRYFAEDKAGNPSPTGEIDVKIDKHAPALVLSLSDDEVVNFENMTISWSCADNMSGVDYYECWLDSAYYRLNNSSLSVSGLSEGSHRFEVHVYDVAGNQAFKSVFFNVSTETTDPLTPDDGDVTALLAGTLAIGLAVLVTATAVLLWRARKNRMSK